MITVLLKNENLESNENRDNVEYRSINLIDVEIVNGSEKSVKKSVFKHLNKINQTYFKHFYNSIGYCGKSIKASFYFLCHAIYPDIFEFSGSDTINELSDVLKMKFKDMKNVKTEQV
jgi:hypothetical protein